MGYVLRVRFASFFTGAALASAAGIYFLHKDYRIAHQAISQQVNSLHESLDGRVSSLEKLKESLDGHVSSLEKLKESLDGHVSSLEKLKEVEAPKHVEAAAE